MTLLTSADEICHKGIDCRSTFVRQVWPLSGKGMMKGAPYLETLSKSWLFDVFFCHSGPTLYIVGADIWYGMFSYSHITGYAVTGGRCLWFLLFLVEANFLIFAAG